MKILNFAVLCACLGFIAVGLGLLLSRGEPVFPSPTPLPVLQRYPVERLSTRDVAKMRIFHIASPGAGVSITDRKSITYLPARRFLAAAQKEGLVKPGYRVAWFAPIVDGKQSQGSISIGPNSRSQSAQIAGCVLLDRTGYIPVSAATKFVNSDMIYIRAENLLSDPNELHLAGKILDFELPDSD